MVSSITDLYQTLISSGKKYGLGQPQVTEPLVECVRASLEILNSLTHVDLVSKIPDKQYYSCSNPNPKQRFSRGINRALYSNDVDEVIKMLNRVIDGDIPRNPAELNCALYTAAISFPAATDVMSDNNKKSPGTFLENLVGHLVASQFGVTPTTAVTAPTLDLDIVLPTDFVFDLGPGKSRIHLPVKASTRERVIQVWAHQRVLDGMHGVNRFRGLLVVLAETNRQTANNSISEVCLPGQWTAYQMYIAQLHRVYYFDVPEPYLKLRNQYPFLEVKAFADFFYESDEIALPWLSVDDPVSDAATGLPTDFIT